MIVPDDHIRQRDGAGVGDQIGPDDCFILRKALAIRCIGVFDRGRVPAVAGVCGLLDRDAGAIPVRARNFEPCGRAAVLGQKRWAVVFHRTDRRRPIAEVGSVAGLRIPGSAVLVCPFRISLIDEAEFAIRLGQVEIHARGGAECHQEVHVPRSRPTIHRTEPEGTERRDEGVELAQPVEGVVEARVDDQHIAPATAEAEVGPPASVLEILGGVCGDGVQIVVHLQVVVAHTAEQAVMTGAADQPVIAEITEDPVLAVFNQRLDAVDSLEGVEVQEEVLDLRQRVVGVVGRRRRPDRTIGGEKREMRRSAFGIVGDCRNIRERDDRMIEVEDRVDVRERLGARNRVVARAAMHPVVAESAVDHVASAELPRGEIDALGQQAIDVDPRPDKGACRRDQLLGVGRRQPVKRLGLAISAGQDDPVIAEDPVLATATEDLVISGAADQVVVIGIAIEDIVSCHAVHDVVAIAGVDDVVAADVVRAAAGRVVEQVVNTRNDLQLLGGVEPVRVGVVVERKETGEAAHIGALDARRATDTDEAKDVAVVGEDHIGIVGMAIAVRIADDRALAQGVARNFGLGARPAKQDVARIRSLLAQTKTVEQRGASANDVVLSKIAKDDVRAAVALDVVVAVSRLVGQRCRHDQPAVCTDMRAHCRGCVDRPDRPVALDHVITKLTEDDVVVGTASDVVAAEGVRRGPRAMIEDGDRPDLGACRVGLRGICHQRLTGLVIEHGPLQHSEARADGVAGPQDNGIVACDDICARAAVDPVGHVETKRNVVPADQVVIATVPEDRVRALLPKDDVVAIGRGGHGDY